MLAKSHNPVGIVEAYYDARSDIIRVIHDSGKVERLTPEAFAELYTELPDDDGTIGD